jgi:hypothetical protein
MYWKPHLAARSRLARARNLETMLTTAKISASRKSTANTGRNLSRATAAIVIRSHYHV